MVNLPATPRGPYRTGLRRREQIIEAATGIFARRGYTGATLREIADGAGVSTAGLLRHFSSKEKLLAAVLDRWGCDSEALMDGAIMGLEWFLQYPDLIEYHQQHPGLVELYLTLRGEASDPDHPARAWLTAHYERAIAIATRQLRIARDAGTVTDMPDLQVEQEVRALYALIDGLELQWISNPGLDLVGIFTSLLESILTRWRVPATLSN